MSQIEPDVTAYQEQVNKVKEEISALPFDTGKSE